MANVHNPKTDGFEDFMLFDTPETTEDDNEIGSRYVNIKGKDYKFQIRDPYGHCFIIPKKGALPEELRGAYTTVQDAERDITRYFNIQEDREAKAAIRKEVDPVVKEKLIAKRQGKKPVVSSGLEVA